MSNRIKVWGVKKSLGGFNAIGEPIVIRPGTFGWLPPEKAKAAVEAGLVEIAAGHSTTSLPTPAYETREETADLSPSAGDAPEPDWIQVTPKKPASKKVSPKRYRRRDITAEEA